MSFNISRAMALREETTLTIVTAEEQHPHSLFMTEVFFTPGATLAYESSQMSPFFRNTFGQGDRTPQLRTPLMCHPNPRVSHRLNRDLCCCWIKDNFFLFPVLLLLLSYRCYSLAISIKLPAQKSLSLSLFPVKSNPGQQQSEHWILTNVSCTLNEQFIVSKLGKYLIP